MQCTLRFLIMSQWNKSIFHSCLIEKKKKKKKTFYFSSAVHMRKIYTRMYLYAPRLPFYFFRTIEQKQIFFLHLNVCLF